MKIFKLILLIILTTFSNNFTQDFWVATAGPDTTTIWSLAIISNGNIFAGTSNAGVFRSTDGGVSWVNLGIANYEIRSMAISSSDDILVNTDPFGGVFRSSDNGDDWNNLGFPHYNRSIAINDVNGYIFVGTGALGIARTVNNGADGWPYINNGMTASKINVLLIKSSEYIFAGTEVNSSLPGSGGVYRSADNGENWVQINSGLSNLDILSLAINSSGYIFAGTSGGGVFRSTDNGDNWVLVSTGLTSSGHYVYSLATNSNGNVIAGTDDGAFKSTDNGNNWTQINTGLTNNKIHSLAINPSGIVFAGTEGGIFKSLSSLPVELTSFKAIIKHNQVKLSWETATEVDNYGFEIEREINSTNNTEWEKIGFVKGNGNSNSPKEYFFIDNSLYGGSKFKYRLKQIDTDGQFEYSEIVEVESEPNQFELSQNYPNPFNPNTTIKFSLPKATQIKINLYNMLGEQVATLAEGNYETGNYKVTFNASSLPSGTYIYRIESSDFTQIKKMVLLK